MPKWTRKAEQLGITRQSFGNHALPSVVEESQRARDDLQFVIDHTSFEGQLISGPEGLGIAERFCRDRMATDERTMSFPDDMVERLLALFVGHVFVETELGRWVAYPGKCHVFVPVVIELLNHPNHYIQPFLFCSQFRSKTGLRGAPTSTSLKWFYENPLKHATK